MVDIAKMFEGIPISWEGAIIFFMIRELLGFVRLYLDRNRINKATEIQEDVTNLNTELRQNLTYIKTLSDNIDRNVAGAIKAGEQQQARANALFNKVDTLYDMHNVRDAAGVPIWYQNPQMATGITRMAESVEGLVRAITEQNKYFAESMYNIQLNQKDIIMQVKEINKGMKNE